MSFQKIRGRDNKLSKNNEEEIRDTNPRSKQKKQEKGTIKPRGRDTNPLIIFSFQKQWRRDTNPLIIFSFQKQWGRQDNKKNLFKKKVNNLILKKDSLKKRL